MEENIPERHRGHGEISLGHSFHKLHFEENDAPQRRPAQQQRQHTPGERSRQEYQTDPQCIGQQVQTQGV